MHPTSSSWVVLGMTVIPLLVAAALIAGYARASRQGRAAFAAAIVTWLALVGAIAAAGLLRGAGRPPPLVPVVVAGLVIAVVAARSRIGERFARGLPLALLIGFHAFRLPLELVMHRAALEGTMPLQMSFGGANFDVASGASALIVAFLVWRGMAPSWLVLAWAVVSSALLAVIVGIAVSSTPLFAAFGRTPERLNTWIEWFPFVWLPAFLVPAALFGQLVVFRSLAREASRKVTPSRA